MGNGAWLTPWWLVRQNSIFVLARCCCHFDGTLNGKGRVMLRNGVAGGYLLWTVVRPVGRDYVTANRWNSFARALCPNCAMAASMTEHTLGST